MDMELPLWASGVLNSSVTWLRYMLTLGWGSVREAGAFELVHTPLSSSLGVASTGLLWPKQWVFWCFNRAPGRFWCSFEKLYWGHFHIYVFPLFCFVFIKACPVVLGPHGQLPSYKLHVRGPKAPFFPVPADMRKFWWEHRTLSCIRWFLLPLFYQWENKKVGDLLISPNLCFFPLNHAAINELPLSEGVRDAGWISLSSFREESSWLNLELERNRLCKIRELYLMDHSVCQSFYLASRLATVDRHCWLWLLPAIAWVCLRTVERHCET